MTVDQVILQQAVHQIKQSQKILITPSSPADGDSLGAALSLYLILRKLGKEPTVVMSDDLPETYEFLPKTDEIHHELSGARDFVITLDCKDAEVDTIKYQVEEDVVNIIVTPKTGRFKKDAVEFKDGAEQYDLIITVDAGDIHQMRDLYEENKEMFETLPLLNIDHHSSNSKYGTINYVDTESSSTTQALIPIIDALNDTGSEIIDQDIATLLLTGLITDTGSFQHANTTPEAFEVASRLLDLGAKQQEIIKKVYKTKSLSTLKLWGRVLSKIQYDEERRLVWSTITTQDLLETNSTTNEANGIIDELMTNAPGAELILLLKQKSDDLVSGSVRTNSDDVDGSAFAAEFGGGGHVRAAGFRVKGKTMQEAEEEVIAAAKAFQENRLNKVAPSVPVAPVMPEQALQEAEKIESEPKVKSEEVVEKLTRDFVAGPADAPEPAPPAPTLPPVAPPVPTAPPAPVAPAPPVTPPVTPPPVAPPVQPIPPAAPAPTMTPPVPPAPSMQPNPAPVPPSGVPPQPAPSIPTPPPVTPPPVVPPAPSAPPTPPAPTMPPTPPVPPAPPMNPPMPGAPTPPPPVPPAPPMPPM